LREMFLRECSARLVTVDEWQPFRRHFRDKRIKTTVLHWGTATHVRDVDENELFVWLPESERASLEAELAGA
jgi:hypothetical protein